MNIDCAAGSLILDCVLQHSWDIVVQQKTLVKSKKHRGYGFDVEGKLDIVVVHPKTSK